MVYTNISSWWATLCAQCDFSKHFYFGNSHPLIVTLYSLWRSMVVSKKKRREGGRGGGRGGREGGMEGGEGVREGRREEGREEEGLNGRRRKVGERKAWRRNSPGPGDAALRARAEKETEEQSVTSAVQPRSR